MMKKLFKRKNTPILKPVATGVTLALASSLAMATGIEPSTAEYTFAIEDKYNGTATRVLTNNGNTWHYKMNARVAGMASATQNSTFTISGNRVIPTQASTTYKLFGLGRTHNLRFDTANKQVVSTYRGDTHTLSAPNGVLDDMSLEIQIRQELLNDSFSGTYNMAKKDKIEATPFRKVGNYTINVPAGSFDTVRIDRIHDDNSRSTSFWLAPSLNYLPVKIIQNNSGKKMQLELTSVR